MRARQAALLSVGLGDRMEHLPNALSGGQQQRVAIARAIITRPCVLLADEPTAGLDPVSAADVLALFDSLHECGHTIVLITHDPAAARRAPRAVSVWKTAYSLTYNKYPCKRRKSHEQTR